jgi:tellurite resistance protein
MPYFRGNFDMTLHEYPFYGLGIVAFSIAQSDGEIQQRERRELMHLIKDWSERVDVGFSGVEVIFELLTKNRKYDVLTYDKGMEYIRKGKEYLTPQLKEKFVFLVNDIAHSFPPVTENERAVVERFQQDLKHL